MRNSSKQNIDYAQCYGGPHSWIDQGVDKTVSFHGRENKTRGRINPDHTIDKHDSLKAES